MELAQEKCPQVPFVFVTANAHQGMLVEMFDSGAAGCVCKSHLTDLGPVIRQALDEAREQSTSRCSLLAADSGAGPSTPTHQSEASDDPHLICSKCKQVRDDGGNWEDLEAHLRKHRQATVTLALCPACQSKRLEQWTLEGGNRR